MQEIYDDELYHNPLEGMGGGTYESSERARCGAISITCLGLAIVLMLIGGALYAFSVLLQYCTPSGAWQTIGAVARIIEIIAVLSLSCWAGWAVFDLGARA